MSSDLVENPRLKSLSEPLADASKHEPYTLLTWTISSPMRRSSSRSELAAMMLPTIRIAEVSAEPK